MLGVQIKPAANGVLVIKVADGSVAESGGLQKDDLIIQAAGTKISKSEELIAIISNQAPGTYLPLRILRDGKRLDVIAKFPTLNENKPHL
jgi:S1-C subfamily serine protease